MKIVFVGDKPSRKNISQDIPFVGTKSYKTLLDWIYSMNIDITDVVTTNIHDFKKRTEKIQFSPKKIVALGENASKFLKGIEHFKLPHPSPLNRKLNDKKTLNSILKECEKYLNDTRSSI